MKPHSWAITKVQGFRFLNKPERCIFVHILIRYPVIDLVLFDGYLLPVLCTANDSQFLESASFSILFLIFAN